MSSDIFAAPSKMKRPSKLNESFSPSKKRMTDFSTFCTWVLDYEASLQHEADRVSKRSTSPLDSEGNSIGSNSSESDYASHVSDFDSISPVETSPPVPVYEYRTYKPSKRERGADWDLVTCYCNKPFSGRPMIECDECETWVHLSCAKIRKTNVPEVFNCQKCRDSKHKIRKSNRVREPKKQFKELYEDS